LPLKKLSGIWGTYLGKLIALFLVLAFALGAVGVCMIYERHRDVVIDLEELPETQRSVSKSDEDITFKFTLNKQGYYFSGFDTYRKDEGDLVVKLYAPLTPGDYAKDTKGYYTIVIPREKGDKTFSLEGEDGIVTSLLELKENK